MAKTGKLGLMGRKFVSVWLSKVPLSWNNPLQATSRPDLNVILLAYIFNYE